MPTAAPRHPPGRELDKPQREKSMEIEHPEAMTGEEAAMYLRDRIGHLAPNSETLHTWSRKAWRAKNAAVVQALSIPAGVSLIGLRKKGWLKTSLDAFADSVIAAIAAKAGAPAAA